MKDADIAAIQTGLRGLGYDVGPIDGLNGPRLRAGARSWLDAGGVRVPLGNPEPQAAVTGAILQGSAKYPVREIVVHCSATLPEWLARAPLSLKREEIRRWHLGRGWKDIGYHWLIDRDGKTTSGRPETVIGAGVEGHNAGVIHICLIGGHGSAATDAFGRHFTVAQDGALRRTIAEIRARTRIDRISGHNEWAAKACPGFTVPAWLKEVQ